MPDIEEGRLARLEVRTGRVEGARDDYALYAHYLTSGLMFMLGLSGDHGLPAIGERILYSWDPARERVTIYYPYARTELGSQLCRPVTMLEGRGVYELTPLEVPTSQPVNKETQPMANQTENNGNQPVKQAAPAPEWLGHYDPKEQAQIKVARLYALNFQEAGLPGHGLLLLIAKMASDINGRDGQTTGQSPTTAEAPAPKSSAPALRQARMPVPDRPDAPHDPEPDEFDRIAPAGGEVALTDKQLKAIYAIGRAQMRLSETQLEDLCAEQYGVMPNQLTKAEASKFIEYLKGDDK